MRRRHMPLEMRAAIITAIRIGRAIINDSPDVARDYRSGLTRSDIVRKNKFCETYSIPFSTAVSAVHYALNGNRGLMSECPYDGLLAKTELEKLCQEHKRENGRVMGRRSAEQGIGAHGLPYKKKQNASLKGYDASIGGWTDEQKYRRNSAGGRAGGSATLVQKKGIHGRTLEQRIADSKKSGRASYEQGKGVHAMTYEQRREIALRTYAKGLGIMTPAQKRAASERAAAAQGLAIWSPAEISELQLLAQQSAYRRGSLIRAKPIAEALNAKYHQDRPVRTPGAVSAAYAKYGHTDQGLPAQPL